MFHATEPSKQVNSEAEQNALGEGWSETYIHRDFPKMKFRLGAGGKVENKIVADPEEESKLGAGWSDTPPPESEPPATPEPL